jgi:hypothetical protein
MNQFKNAVDTYESNRKIYDAHLAKQVQEMRLDRDVYKQMAEDQYFRRIIWKLLFVISFGINAAYWIGGIW